jgi:hypothetical protein
MSEVFVAIIGKLCNILRRKIRERDAEGAIQILNELDILLSKFVASLPRLTITDRRFVAAMGALNECYNQSGAIKSYLQLGQFRNAMMFLSSLESSFKTLPPTLKLLSQEMPIPGAFPASRAIPVEIPETLQLGSQAASMIYAIVKGKGGAVDMKTIISESKLPPEEVTKAVNELIMLGYVTMEYDVPAGTFIVRLKRES